MLEVGTKAPAFTLPDKDGKVVSLADFAKDNQDSIQNAAKYLRRICGEISF